MVPINVEVNDVPTNSTVDAQNTQNTNDNSTTTNTTTTTTTENDMTKIESTMQSNESSQNTDADDIPNEPQAFEDSIRIRLKYLNDNCRLVEGRLQENIGVFKRY